MMSTMAPLTIHLVSKVCIIYILFVFSFEGCNYLSIHYLRKIYCIIYCTYNLINTYNIIYRFKSH